MPTRHPVIANRRRTLVFSWHRALERRIPVCYRYETGKFSVKDQPSICLSHLQGESSPDSNRVDPSQQENADHQPAYSRAIKGPNENASMLGGLSLPDADTSVDSLRALEKFAGSSCKTSMNFDTTSGVVFCFL